MADETPKPNTGPIIGYEKAWVAGVPIPLGGSIVVWAILANYGFVSVAPPVELLIGAVVALGSGITSAIMTFMTANTKRE